MKRFPTMLLLPLAAAFWPCPASGQSAFLNGIELPGRPAGVLDNCPRLDSFRAVEAYPSEPSGLREVAEAPASALPLPADDLPLAGLIESLKNTLAYWQKKPDSFTIRLGRDSYGAAQMRRTTQKLIDLLSSGLGPAELREALRTGFRIYRSAADDGSGKIVLTGYYEAEIPVSRQRDAEHPYPLYLRPADLVKTAPGTGVDFDYGRIDENGKLVRYYSREEISGGAIAGRGLELVWSGHPAQIMLLQIQGSGVLRFPDGDFIKTGFDGANGWPFKSVQRLLKECGEIPDMSFKDFIAYLSSQSGGREARLVDLNPRYIFFKSRPKDSPAYGAMGAGLTPGRSIAVDPEPLPLGVTALIASRKPVAGAGGSLSFSDFTRFVTAQDTGSAIRGPGRIDLFWGSGAAAETEASSMKAKGELYVLVAR